jgi:ketosteroid isomerase-like protein
MSQRDLDTVREMIDAFNSTDLDRMLALADPEFEAAVPPELSAEPDTYRGHEGIRRYFASFQEVMDEISFEAEDLWDAGGAVILTLTLSAFGRHSSIPVRQRLAQVWRVRDGRVLAVESYAHREQALEAAGAAGRGRAPLPGDATPTPRA